MVRNWSESEAERDGSEARAGYPLAGDHGRNSASGGDDLKLRPATAADIFLPSTWILIACARFESVSLFYCTNLKQPAIIVMKPAGKRELAGILKQVRNSRNNHWS